MLDARCSTFDAQHSKHARISNLMLDAQTLTLEPRHSILDIGTANTRCSVLGQSMLKALNVRCLTLKARSSTFDAQTSTFDAPRSVLNARCLMLDA
jgi:hypothetical protein